MSGIAAAPAYELTAELPATIPRGEAVTLLLRVRQDGRPVEHVTTCLAATPLFASLEDTLDTTPAGGIDLGPGGTSGTHPGCAMAIAGVPTGPGTYAFTWEPDTAGRVELTFTAGAGTLTVPANVASAPPSAGVLVIFALVVAAALAGAVWLRRQPVAQAAERRRGLSTGDHEHPHAAATETVPAAGRATWMMALLRSRLYPAVFQWITVAAFFVILGSTLFGPNNSGQNLGMAITWTVWWALLPLSFLLAGRFWCAICPLTWLMDRVQHVVGARRPAPRRLVRHGLWVIAALFLLVTYIDETWRLADDARRTGYLLLAIVAGAIAVAALFERRTFCRHVCFVGGFAGNYSRAGMLELRAEASRCRTCHTQDCYRGSERAPGCPVFLSAAGLDDSSTCHLCGNCVKSCPHDAIRVSCRPPTSELWGLRQASLPDAVLVGTLGGVVLLEQIARLQLWFPLVDATGRLLRLDPYVWYPLVYAVLLAAFAAVPLAAMALAGLLSEALAGTPGRASVRRNAVTFAYGLIPVVLASHLALNAFDLLARSRTVPFAFLAMLGSFPGRVQAAWLPRSALFPVEVVVLALGAAGSMYAIDRLARRLAPRAAWAAGAPYGLLVLGLLAANLYVYLRP